MPATALHVPRLWGGCLGSSSDATLTVPQIQRTALARCEYLNKLHINLALRLTFCKFSLSLPRQVMYKEQVDALSGGGYTSAGYTGIHMDDCWEEKVPGRDPRTGELRPNATRFPSGMAALGKYMHSHGATFGLYTAESPTTCGGYPCVEICLSLFFCVL